MKRPLAQGVKASGSWRTHGLPSVARAYEPSNWTLRHFLRKRYKESSLLNSPSGVCPIRPSYET
jgi:hypothetical protein